MSEPLPNDSDYPSSDIAIVGMAGRFPGASNVGEYWDNLRRGVESIRPLSSAELQAAGVTDVQLRNPNFVRVAATLDNLDQFDAAFFGINPKESAIMDPQQRLFLECAWEALENAGHAGSPGELTGVFAGSGPNSYLFHNLLSNRDLVDTEGIFVLRHMGNDKDVLATRVSYQFDLRGPSVNVQTACSTSLVAVHLACQSLLNQECDLALAGAVSIEIPHGAGYVYRTGEILSRDGHCRAFDAQASGTVFGSGVGLVVLRRLADALADGETIHAIIKGSAINNDGARKVGFLAPSVQGQVDVVSEALAVADIDPATVDYIEAHGTGTAIGDPIELSALGQVFAGRTRPLLVGSVKTNIGHLDTASGIAGLIKTALALSKRQIPPTLHFTQPNPQLDFKVASFKVADQLQDWPVRGGPRRAGVTSLGIGGSNAHVVLEEPPLRKPEKTGRQHHLLTFSAKSAEALDQAAQDFSRHLEANPGLDLSAAACTLHLGRRAFSHRRSFVCESVNDALAALRPSGSNRAATGQSDGRERTISFIFSGQGAQCVNMGRGLYQNEPVFKKWIDASAAIATPILGADFRKALYPDAGALENASVILRQTWITQPALFAVEYALAQLWMSWGIRPSQMLGHSIGEYVAAGLAGVFSFEDAVTIVAHRGMLMREIQDGGVMLAVGQSEVEIQRWLNPELSLAVVNGPSQCVVAGSLPAIERLEKDLIAQRVPARRLQTSHAFHSHLMEPVVGRFVEKMRSIRLNPPQIPTLSNVSGTWLTAGQATDCQYWGKHLRATVRFHEGLAVLLQNPDAILLEVGPGETLSALARRHPARRPQQEIVSSLPAPENNGRDVSAILSTLGRLWNGGVEVDWTGYHQGETLQRIPLPTYPFQRRRCWIGPGIGPGSPAETRTGVDHWFYKTVWKSETAKTRANAAGPWLIFCDTGGAGKKMAGELPQRGDSVITVSIGDHFQQRSPDSFSLDPSSEKDFALLFDAIPRDKWPERIIYFWALDSPSSSDRLPFFDLLTLSQQLAKRAGTRPVMVNVVTDGAVSVRGEPVRHPEQAVVAGPCRVAGQEHPNLKWRWLDVDSTSPDFLAGAAISEFSSGSGDAMVTVRDGGRWVQTLEPITLATTRDRLRERGVYLITGGLGGLGLAAARWLNRSCRARLVLTGRNAESPSAGSRKEIEEMERNGSEVCLVSADVADATAMRRALDEGMRRFGVIHGVIHAAGVLDDGVIELKTRSRAAAVLSPKVQGTKVLAGLLKDVPLDFLALFSSVSAVLPPAGQVDYCAANAFLNAFAESCLPDQSVVAIGWSAWGEVGMARYTGPAGAPIVPSHPLLDTISRETDGGLVCHGELAAERNWILREHRLRGGPALLPGTGHLELATTVFWRRNGVQPAVLRDVAFLQPFLVDDSKPVPFDLSLRQNGSGYHFSTSGGTSQFAGGKIEAARARAEKLDLTSIAGRIPGLLAAPKNVRQNHHFDFGPRWSSLQWIRLAERECLAELKLPAEFSDEAGTFALHPALLDMATGASLFLIPGYDKPGEIHLPFSYRQATVYRALPAHVFSHVRLKTLTTDLATFDITITDHRGDVVMDISEFAVKRVADLKTNDLNNMSGAPAGAAREPVVESRFIGTRDGIEALSRILDSGTRGVVLVSPRKLEWPVASPENRPARAVAAGGDIENTLKGMWQRMLGVDDIPLDSDFFQLGGHSLIAVRLFAEIREVFRVDLGLATLFEARTLAALAAKIREQREPGQTGTPQLRCIVPIRSGDSKPPFFCIHGIGGNLLNYEALVRYMSPDQPVYGIQSSGIDGSSPDTSLEQMATRYIQEMRKLQPEGPYFLGGHSFGGLVAYEMGCQLETANEEVGLIALIDTTQYHLPTGQWWSSFATSAIWTGSRIGGHLAKIMTGPGRLDYLRARARTIRRKLSNFRYRMSYGLVQTQDRELPASLRNVTQANFMAIRRYRPRPSGCSVTLFRGATRSLGDHPDYYMGWRHLAGGGIKTFELPGDHLSIMQEPNVKFLAQTLDDCLSGVAGAPAREPVSDLALRE